MARKERQALLAPAIVPIRGGALAGGAIEPNTGVAVTSDQMRAVRRVRLTLTNVVVSVTAANDYGGTKIADLPDTNLLLLATEVDLELVKGGVTNGIVAATDVNVAIGTAVASNATLSGAMVDVMSITALTATDASPAYQAHSQADGTLSYPIELADSATLALYLNVAASITADDTITASGTIDLVLIDIGNQTS